MSVVINPAPLDRFRNQPDILRRLIGLYLEITPACIEKIQQSIADGDAEQLAFHAHSLKGSSSELGAERMAELGQQLQLAAKSGDDELIASLAGDLEQSLADTTIALESLNPG